MALRRFVIVHRLLGILLLTARVSIAAPLLTEAQFSQWFDQFQDPRTMVSSAAAPEVSGFQYVFVPGILNETFRPFYFRGFRSELKKLGVPKQQLFRHAGASLAAVEKNAPKLFRFLESVVKKDPTKPIVLTGHSKGAAEIVAMALQNPEFVRDHVHASFLVQGAIRGSGVADYLLGTGIAPDEKMPEPVRTIWRAAGLLFKPLVPIARKGLGSVGHEVAGALMERLLQERPDAPALLEEKLYYLRSAKTPVGLWNPIAWSGFYLDPYYGRGDWRLTLEDQYLPGVGRLLLLADAHHDDFVGPNLGALFHPHVRNLRRSLARSVATAVAYRSGNCSLEALQPQR